MAMEISAEKRRGAYYTPFHLAQFLVQWAVRSPFDRILDPACGDGAFLHAIGAHLSCQHIHPRHDQIVGFEIDSNESAQARGAAPFATVVEADFFTREPAGERYDVVIGNPPYIRYHHFNGEMRARAMARARQEGVILTGLASSWAPFVVHASTFLRSYGRLALVLPAELLSTDYAEPVRTFLQERFERVDIVTFEERVFPGAMVDAVLLLADGSGPGAVHVHRLHNASALEAFDLGNAREITAPKWTEAFLTTDATALLTEGATRMRPLGTIASVDIGIVTGANRFFLLDEQRVDAFGIAPYDRRRLVARGHHMPGHVFSRRMWEQRRRAGDCVWLFTPRSAVGGAGTYIRRGEESGAHTSYKCRIRSPWWKLKLPAPPDLILSYMSNRAPRLVANTAGVLTTNLLHNVRLRDASVDADVLSLSWTNSATLLSSELSGRAYGGGVLKLETREAERVIVPHLSGDAVRALRDRAPIIDDLLASGDIEGVTLVVDPVVLAYLDVAQRAYLRAAWRDLYARRKRRVTPAEASA